MSVLAILERAGDVWHRGSWETLAAAQQVAAQLGRPAAAAVPGAGARAAAQDLAGKQLDRVWAVEDPLLERYTPEGWASALEALVRRQEPSLVLFPHTYQTRDYAPRLAARFGRALVSDAVRIRVEDGEPVPVRQYFQGKLIADLRFTVPGPHFISIQAGSYRGGEVKAGQAPVEVFEPLLGAGTVRTVPGEPFRESAGAVDLSNAARIVAAGRGVRDQEGLRLVEELARALDAELAASRPICDNGWLPMERQVGSSGQSVAPRLYVAVGISGAIQHLVGMKGSETVVAINKDPEAPIFEAARYGVLSDLFEFVPALIEELRKLRG